MKAMILAAGLGTRLGALTCDRPKALVEIAGRSLLDIAITRLKSFGVTEIIVNAHHFADQVIAYLDERGHFGIRMEVSREDDLLDTGGGLKKASWFFTEDSRTDRPFLLHNVDVMSTIDLAEMLSFHRQNGALATLAVQSRPTSRPLIFSSEGQLLERAASDSAKAAEPRPSEPGESGRTTERLFLAFSGIHALSPSLLPLLSETGAFSIVDAYLRLSRSGYKIIGFPADQYFWRDLGRPSDLAAAAADLQKVEASDRGS